MVTLILCTGLFTGCEESSSAAVDPSVITGELYDTGEFQVFVSEGWRIFPVTDPFADGRPVKTDCIQLNKGGESDWHVFEKPYLQLDYFSPDEPIEQSSPDPALWRDIEEYPPMQFGDLIWNGYAADNYHGRARIGRFAILWTEQDGHHYQALICFKSGGESIRLEDADVQAVLASLAPADVVSADTE